jgi:hypothetical protein
MQITRNNSETTLLPSEWFTGTVYIDTVRAIPPRSCERPLHPCRSHRLARPPPRTDYQRHRGRRPCTALRRTRRGYAARRPVVLRVWRGLLARRPNRFMSHIAM